MMEVPKTRWEWDNCGLKSLSLSSMLVVNGRCGRKLEILCIPNRGWSSGESLLLLWYTASVRCLYFLIYWIFSLGLSFLSYRPSWVWMLIQKELPTVKQLLPLLIGPLISLWSFSCLLSLLSPSARVYILVVWRPPMPLEKGYNWEMAHVNRLSRSCWNRKFGFEAAQVWYN